MDENGFPFVKREVLQEVCETRLMEDGYLVNDDCHRC